MPEPMGKLDTSVSGPEGLPEFDGDAWERVDWCHQEEQVLAATLSAHDSAAFGVHVPAGLGGDAGARGRGSGVRAGVGSRMAEEGGEGGDGFE
jgi:hypothetical protein